VLRPVVTATCWVDPGDSGTPYESVIRFTGRRVGAAGKPSPGDSFEQEEAVQLVPGSGPVAITTRVAGVSAGEWLVRARPADRHGRERAVDPAVLLHGTGVRRMTRVLWPKGNPVAPVGPGTTGSRWGIWSSDGRIGAWRLPAQQLESLVCLLIGIAALAAFLRFGRSAGGTVFIGAMATCTLARQALLALRAEPRRWSLARPVTFTVSTALLVDLLISAVG
jgi:hypothetical protein